MDLANGTVTVSLGMFVLLAGLAWVGLMITGAAMYIAITSYWQRGEMMREIKRYNALMSRNNVLRGPALKTKYWDWQVGTSSVPMEFLEDRD